MTTIPTAKIGEKLQKIQHYGSVAEAGQVRSYPYHDGKSRVYIG
jgi:hypothetical protein